MQQTLLNMHRARGRYRPGADVYPWMFTIAARLIIDRHRTLRHRPAVGDSGTWLPDTRPNPEQRAAAVQLGARLDAELERLPARQQQALTLTRRDGLSHRQAADTLGTSESAIKSLVHRALVALRRARERDWRRP